MMRGSTAALAAERILAIGFLPRFSPHFLEAITSAAAPSLMPEALPAVTTPPSNRGFNLARESREASRRGCASVLTGMESFLEGIVTRRDSALVKTSFFALGHVCRREHA